MFSFINGMQSFPKAIAAKLKNKIQYESNVKSVERGVNNLIVKYEHNGELKEINTDFVLSTIPVHSATQIFSNLDSDFEKHARAIYYPPVMVLFLGFNKKDIRRKLDGFGFLIPSKEKKSFLGAIWSSTIFPNRCNNENAAFTLFIGGARSPYLFDLEKEKLIEKVLIEFKQIMNISNEPLFIKDRMWNKAIPQYNLGYIEHENYFDKFENEHKGIFISGNFRGGISVGDCIKNSEITMKRIQNIE
jgi:oxygen-dependent protoporphyrinogen oxidase